MDTTPKSRKNKHSNAFSNCKLINILLLVTFYLKINLSTLMNFKDNMIGTK